jgi:hypothetical protein
VFERDFPTADTAQKAMRSLLPLLAAMILFGAVASALAGGNSPDELPRRSQERRAIEAVIWGMPAVNTERGPLTRGASE